MSYFGLATDGVFSVISIILAIAATVLAFIFIVPDKKREKLNKFGKFLHDTLNFKYLIVEKILQALYIFLTAFVILYGFLLLFRVETYNNYYSGYSSSHWFGGYGIALMLLGPISVRLVYELLMMVILLVKNVIGINNKLKNQNEGKSEVSPFAAPDLTVFKSTPAAPAQNTAYPQNAQPTVPQVESAYCPTCGALVPKGTFCPNCGTKV